MLRGEHFRVWTDLDLKWSLISVVAALCLTCSLARAEDHVVETTLGNITGSIEYVDVYNDMGYFSVERYVQYLGIPYAEPPTGSRRFAKPEVKSAWSYNETYNATYYRPSCYHLGSLQKISVFDTKDADMSEDCLTLSIYTPVDTTLDSKLFPVMVFFPTSGSTSGPFVGDIVSAYGKLVVVVVNFRQGLFGFFSTDDAAAPGNLGLWDQQLAITWINENIASFGGDAELVTLVGHSTGGADAILQSFYMGNRGYIKRVVGMSGTPFPVYNDTLYFGKPSGKDFAVLAGCDNETNEDIVSCLRGMTVEDLEAALNDSETGLVFKPVIDGNIVKANPKDILDDDTELYAVERDGFLEVDLLLGLNKDGGSALIALLWAELLGTNMTSFQINRTQFDNTLIPTLMRIVFKSNVSDSVTDTVILQYSDLTDPTDVSKIRQSVVDISTDLDIAAPLLVTANAHSRAVSNTTYMYQFSESLQLPSPLTPPWSEGANRGDDVFSLFGFSQRGLDVLQHGSNFTPSAEQRMASRGFMTAVTNFIKTG